MEQYVAVIGGANVDIGGQSRRSLVPRDSNPGSVRLSAGGVGRNIAQNLAQLGVKTLLFSAIGTDINGKILSELSRQGGLELRHVRQVPDGRTSTYLYLNGPDGDMALAVSDMEICRCITKDYLAASLNLLQGASAVVVDTNLPEETLGYLAAHCQAPIFADPVSTGKAPKLLPILHWLYAIKPNRLEAELLTGRKEPEQAASLLLERGVRQVYLSLGADGLLAATREQILTVPGFRRPVVCTTGAGDACTAGLVWAYLHGLSLADTARAAMAAAAITIESPETNSPNLSQKTLIQQMEESL